MDKSVTSIWVLSACVAKKFITILWKTFTRTCTFFNYTVTSFVSNYAQPSALKVGYIFKSSWFSVA